MWIPSLVIKVWRINQIHNLEYLVQPSNTTLPLLCHAVFQQLFFCFKSKLRAQIYQVHYSVTNFKCHECALHFLLKQSFNHTHHTLFLMFLWTLWMCAVILPRQVLNMHIAKLMTLQIVNIVMHLVCVEICIFN